MTRQPNQNHLNLQRRHAGKCPVQDVNLLDKCECPLWVYGRLHGKTFRQSLDTRDQLTALVKRKELLAEAQNNPEPDPTPTTPAPVAGIHAVVPATPAAAEPAADIPLADAMRQFLEAKERRSINTMRLYKRACDHFLHWAETQNLTHLKQIGLADVRAYFKEYEDGWKDNTAQNRLTHLRVFFGWCKKPAEGRDWIPFSPAASDQLGYSTASERLPFSDDQVARIPAAIERLPKRKQARARALVLLLLNTGMRISDATFFRRDYINAKGGCKYWIIKTRKELKATIQLHPTTLAALAALPDLDGPYFFQGGDFPEAHRALKAGPDSRKEFAKLVPGYDERVEAAMRLVVRVMRLAGITEGGCHRFRDTFAINLLVKDVPILKVCDFLGHSDVKITYKHYYKALQEHQEKMGQDALKLDYLKDYLDSMPLAG